MSRQSGLVACLRVKGCTLWLRENKSKEKSMATKQTKAARPGNRPDVPTAHWTQVITREKPALLSERNVRCYFVLKNHGPDPVLLVAENGDYFVLRADAVRASYAHGIIRVEDRGKKSAFIEFEFLPLQSK
jgi:hypothetical protein